VLQSIDSRLVTLLLAAILIVGTLGMVRPDTFLSPLNINSMLLQSSVIGLLSLAVAVTMLTGGIDLSINATANVTSIVVAALLSKTIPAEGGNATLAITAVALVVGLLVGFGCGLFNGFLIAILGYSPILATLGTMTLFVGIGTVLTGGNTLFGISAFAAVGRGSALGIPLPAIIFLLAALVLSLVLEARRFGFYLYLYGANESAARFSGINEHRLIFSVYAVSGVLSAVAGLINLGVTNSANVDYGASYVLLAIHWRGSRCFDLAVPVHRSQPRVPVGWQQLPQRIRLGDYSARGSGNRWAPLFEAWPGVQGPRPDTAHS
jgi:simple sugar transport system permease protein